ncbi:MAG TPA: ATP-dependent helicase [Candidatus Didemnitutus sp.]|nr:ATP-dependent helicase [Candidatus Didemnitutus sp.]
MDFVLPSESTGLPPVIPPIDFRAQLNDEQFAAVTAPPGPMLVLAGAGSGKTRTLTYRVAYLLSQGARPHEILLLTFTNKAAKEMLHRVEDLTGIPGHRFWGGTFHHIGHKILRMYGDGLTLPKNFTILDADEADGFLRDTVEAIEPAFFKDKTHPRPGVLHEIISFARNTQRPFAETITQSFPQHDAITDRIATFAKAYRERKQKQAVADYDDLLEYWLELLQGSAELRGYLSQRFRHVLVDEYQDTNTLQSQIIDLLASHHQIMAVGDDAQCIYTWRGANFENIMTFPDRHPGTQIYHVETNYRSTPQILQFANGVLAAQPKGRHFDKELKPARSDGEQPFLVATMDSREQAAFVCQRLKGLHDEGRSLSDVAVLYRAHFQALDMQLELSRLGIPYVITSGVRFFEQAHVRDLVALLRFVYNPSDVMAWQRVAVLLPKVGDKGAHKLHALALDRARATQKNYLDALASPEVAAKVPAGAREEWPRLITSLLQVGEVMRTEKPSQAVETAIDGWYGDYLKGAFANYASRLDDLKSLVGFASRYEEMQDLLAQIVLLNSETSDRQVDPDADALKLTTVHQAKGLEYGVVFLIGLADGQFPLRRAIEAGDVEEERRLFYVAVTRAKDELYLCYPRVNTKGGPQMLMPPSRFIQETPDTLYQELRLKRSWGW